MTVRTTPSRYPNWSRVYHYALHRDHLGSVHTTTDDNGTAGTPITHDPFGGGRRHDWSRGSTQSERVASLESLAYRYVRTGLTGHEALERTGITHMNGRLYDPVIGRFLNADPYVQSPGFSQSHNRYSYVMNSPTGLVDPSGYQSCQSFGNRGAGDGDSGSTGFGFRITSCSGSPTPGLNPRSILNQLLRAYQNMLRWEATANGQIMRKQIAENDTAIKLLENLPKNPEAVFEEGLALAKKQKELNVKASIKFDERHGFCPEVCDASAIRFRSSTKEGIKFLKENPEYELLLGTHTKGAGIAIYPAATVENHIEPFFPSKEYRRHFIYGEDSSLTVTGAESVLSVIAHEIGHHRGINHGNAMNKQEFNAIKRNRQ